MNAQRLLKARTSAPACPGFDAWFLALLFDALEPMQAGILIWVLEQGGEARSDAMTAHFKTTPQRVGSAVSDLRRLSLLTSAAIEGEATRATMHRAAAWCREVWQR
jgi:hypothetical protein